MTSDFTVLEKLLLEEDVAEIRRRVESVRQGAVEAVAAYWDGLELGFSGVAASGRLITWTMFPAPDEATVVETSHAQFVMAVELVLQATERAAACRFLGPDSNTAH